MHACTDVALCFWNDCYWFIKPILVLIHSLSGIYGNLRSAESSPVNIKFHTELFGIVFDSFDCLFVVAFCERKFSGGNLYILV